MSEAFQPPRRGRRMLERALPSGARREPHSSSLVVRLLGAFRQDLAIALRGIGRAPGFAITVVVTLTLGIGTNHVMFRVIDRILLRAPEHVEDAGRVVRIFYRSILPGHGQVDFKASTGYPDFRDLAGARFFERTAAYTFDNPVVGEGEDAESVLSQWATADLFPLLGVKPALGRFFSAEEDRTGSTRTAVLAWSYWMRRFGGDPRVLGQDLRVGKEFYTVIGVAPRGFTGPSLAPVQIWLPFHPTAAVESGEGWATARVWTWLSIVARLTPGVTRELAQAEATRLLQTRTGDEDPARERSVVLTSLMAADEPEVPAWASVAKWLAGVSALVWIIAAANVANLMLAREIRRRRETAVRLALGVSRARVLGQFMTEALVLALPAAAAAAVVAGWGGQAVGKLLLPELSFESAGHGGRILVFTLGTAVLTALIAGLAPAVQASRRDATEELGAGSRRSRPRSRVQDVLLVTQGAFAAVMLVAAGLYVRSLLGVESKAHVGLDPDPVVLAQLFFEPGQEDPAETSRIFHEAMDRLRRTPAVQQVAAATIAPFAGGRGVHIELPGGEPLPDPPGRTVGPDQVHVTPEFFRTVGMRIVAGRGFVRADEAAGAERVAVISRTMADHYWPARGPLGECISVDWEQACTRIVGVSSDIRWHGPGWRAPLVVYLPLGRRPMTPRDLLVRVAEDADLGLMTLRRELRAVSARIRFVGVRPLSVLVAAHAAPWRLGATMCVLFGCLALLVAAVGLYGLMTFKIAQRRQEIALRGVLGATRLRITGMILEDGGILVAAGVTLGLLIAALSSRWVEPLLFEVSGRDPFVYLVVAATLLVVGLLASALPARRATRVDPAEALRGD